MNPAKYIIHIGEESFNEYARINSSMTYTITKMRYELLRRMAEWRVLSARLRYRYYQGDI